MEKIMCEYCGDEFQPDDDNDIYCCEECMEADTDSEEEEDD